MGNPWKLTDRQAQVMDLLVAGACNKMMADQLGIGIKTVEGHTFEALKAMKATRPQAAVLWDRWRRQRSTRYAWTAHGMQPNPHGAWMMTAADGVGGAPRCGTSLANDAEKPKEKPLKSTA